MCVKYNIAGREERTGPWRAPQAPRRNSWCGSVDLREGQHGVLFPLWLSAGLGPPAQFISLHFFLGDLAGH